MKGFHWILITLSVVFNGCSILNPYEDEFICEGKAGYGRCASVEEAYNTSLETRNNNQGAFSQNDNKTDNDEINTTANRIVAANNHALGEYRRTLYQELSGLLEQPTTPMIKPPKSIRTLILPYGTKKLYMPRYVYILVEEPTFVLGDYLSKPESQYIPIVKPIQEQ